MELDAGARLTRIGDGVIIRFRPIRGLCPRQGIRDLFYRRSAQWDVRRLALLAVALAQIVASGATAPLSALADQDDIAFPVHLESPQDANCPAKHNHLFCQVVRSIAQPLVAPFVETAVLPASFVVVSWVGSADGGHAGLDFLVGSVIPRGPPLG